MTRLKRPTRSPDPVRRRTLLALGAAVVSPHVPAQPAPRRPACYITAQQTEGPYFLDTRLKRSDLRKDPADGSVRPGVPLLLTLRLRQDTEAGCVPLAGATVHVWHCDAEGTYSGIDGSRSQFLRGYQVSGKDGVVRFRTIYPGWYPGRTVHVHLKVRTQDRDGKPHELTSQLHFDDAITDKVMAQQPYAKRGQRDRINRSDGLFRRSGRELMLKLSGDDKGYAAEFDVGVAFG